jgi:predicted  nucleic acid-binding Zn-ribbon protein
MTRPTKTTLLALLLLVVGIFAQGCALESPASEDIDVGTSWSELSTRQTLLTAAQYKRLETDLTKAADATSKEIAELTTEITKTEAEQMAALAEIDSLLAQIRRRRDELEANRNTATAGSILGGIFGFLVGGPIGMVIGAGAVGAGAYAINTDSQLNALDQQLSAAESRKATAQANLDAYQKRKASLEEDLAALQKRETNIKSVLAQSASKKKVATPASLTSFPSVPKRARKARLLGELLQNLVDQRETLGEILVLAKGVQAELTTLTKDLEELRDEADELVAKSRQDLFKILAVMMAADPMAAATAWLESAVAARAKEVLEDLDIPVIDFAMFLVDVWDKGRSFAADPTAAVKKAFADNVVKTINDATGIADWTVVKYTEKQLIAAALGES